MTKVRFLRRLVTVDHGVAEVGSVVDVDDRHAERLTQLGYTEPADTVTPPDDDDGRDGDVKPATTSASSSRRTRKR